MFDSNLCTHYAAHVLLYGSLFPFKTTDCLERSLKKSINLLKSWKMRARQTTKQPEVCSESAEVITTGNSRLKYVRNMFLASFSFPYHFFFFKNNVMHVLYLFKYNISFLLVVTITTYFIWQVTIST